MPTHDERTEAWRHYVQENGPGGVPANTLRAIGTVHRPAMAPGFHAPQNQSGQKPMYFGPMPSGRGVDLSPRPVAPTHVDRSVKVGQILIRVDGSKDPQETARQVSLELDKHFGSPRSLLNSSSESRTHRALPSILTKAQA